MLMWVSMGSWRHLASRQDLRPLRGCLRGPPPWDIGRPQPAFAALTETGAVAGRALDVGCGTGEHTLMAAGTGLDAVGMDSAPTAIDRARRKAEDPNLAARFILGDPLALDQLVTSPTDTFDTVLDCELFHVFTDQDRLRYVASLRAATGQAAAFTCCASTTRPPATTPGRGGSLQQKSSPPSPPTGDIHEIHRDSIYIASAAPLPAWVVSLVRR